MLLALSLVGWLFGGAFGEKLRAFRHPVAGAALLLYGLTIVASAYGEVDLASTALHLRKYADLLLIPVFLWLFREARARRNALHGLAASLVLVLTLSYLTKAGLMPVNPFTIGSSDYPIVFKQHLTHNILIAFAAFLFAWLAWTAGTFRRRAVWTALAVLALLNVTLLVHGATGYMVLAGLLLLFGYMSCGWRGATTAVFGMTLLVAALVITTNPFHMRVNKIARELQEMRVDEPAGTSTALRLEFYRNTLAMIRDRPLLGVGTGGFAGAYAEKVNGTGMTATQNPHNEFLLMWAQVGIAGLLALIWLFWRQWRLAARLPTRLESELARGLVLTMVIGCMLNSLLLDHTEGLFYAWLTGVLYGGLESGEHRRNARSEARVVAENSA